MKKAWKIDYPKRVTKKEAEEQLVKQIKEYMKQHGIKGLIQVT